MILRHKPRRSSLPVNIIHMIKGDAARPVPSHFLKISMQSPRSSRNASHLTLA